MTTRRRSSPSTGPTLPGFETCEKSTPERRVMFPTPTGYDATPGGPGNHYKGLGWMGKHAPSVLNPSTSSAGGFPAKTCPSLGSVLGSQANGRRSGQSLPDSFASLNPAGCWLKTCQGCSQVMLDGSLETFCETWPRAGTMRNGTAYQLPQLVPLTDVIGCSLWDTPSVADAHPRALNRTGPYWGKGQKHLQAQAYNTMFPTPTDASKGGGSSRSGKRRNEIPTLQGMARKGMWPTPRVSMNNGPFLAEIKAGDPKRRLEAAVALWPTPTASFGERGGIVYPHDNHDTAKRFREMDSSMIGGQLNPTWVEWLMGFLLGWTDLEPSETP